MEREAQMNLIAEILGAADMLGIETGSAETPRIHLTRDTMWLAFPAIFPNEEVTIQTWEQADAVTARIQEAMKAWSEKKQEERDATAISELIAMTEDPHLIGKYYGVLVSLVGWRAVIFNELASSVTPPENCRRPITPLFGRVRQTVQVAVEDLKMNRVS